jgi:uncharacterized protein YebE (UPF0316 family)
MDLGTVFGVDVFRWILLPLFIFIARIMDVSLGTMRIVFVSKGLRRLAPLVGFFEVFIWIIAIKEVMQNLTNIVGYIAYAGGFAMGNYIGLKLEKRLAIGVSMIRVVTNRDPMPLFEALIASGVGVTKVKGEGRQGEVGILFMIVHRAEIDSVMEQVKKFNPRAFYTIEDVGSVRKGGAMIRRRGSRLPLGPFRFFRKGK